MKYYTADTHFNHKNIIKYSIRPFKSVEEMNTTMIKNWNNMIKSNDTVYHLGDVGFGDISQILNKLNGKIILIKGNHEGPALKYKNRFERIYDLHEIRIGDNISLIMCHYALRVWNKSHFNSWHIFGHSHGTLPPIGKTWDVGVDYNNFQPIPETKLIEILKQRPNNTNLIRG